MLSKNNRSYNVKSNHTSMMFPYNLNEDRYSVTLVSKYYLSDTYKNGYGDEKLISNIKYFYEPEIVNYFDYKLQHLPLRVMIFNQTASLDKYH